MLVEVEKEEKIRSIVDTYVYLHDKQNVDLYIKTLTTYEWCFPENVNISWYRVGFLFHVINIHGFELFPLTVKLYNLFTWLKSNLVYPVGPTIYISRIDLLAFYIDTGFDIHSINYYDMYPSVLKMGAMPYKDTKNKYVRTVKQLGMYFQRVMITF
jgi:hypothetical protein